MRIFYLIILFFLLTAVSCQKDETLFTLKGNISHLQNDTLLLYNEYSPNGIVDTIIVDNGKFTFRTALDTITAYKLLINGQITYPIYADKHLTVEIVGNAQEPETLKAKGGSDNEYLNMFRDSLSPDLSETAQRAYADRFIRNNPHTFCNLYLLETYFLRCPTIPYKQLKELIACMDGRVQDAFYTRRINEDIKKKAEISLLHAPSFTLRDGNKLISSSNYYKKVYILHVWASWDGYSREINQMLKHIYSKYKKEKTFDMLGISFDQDEKTWQEAVKNDSLEWKQVREPEGFNSRTATNLALEHLPTYYLIDSKRKILAINPTETELINKLEEALKESKKPTDKKK